MATAIDSFLHDQGFITRPQVLSLGWDDEAIRLLLRSKRLIWIGPGLYAAPEYQQLDDEAKHLVRCRAVATRFTGRAVFSHQTAVLLHDIALWGVDLDDVHVTRVDGGRARHHAHVAHHAGFLPADQITVVDGLEVVDAARSVWDLATTASLESAVVTADSALNRGITDRGALMSLAPELTDWRGSRRAKAALSLADGRAESPGESRLRLLMRLNGLPKPEPQHPIFDEDGVLIGVTDLALPAFRHVIEFDGLVKYGSAADLAKEKAREDAIRRQGWGVTRVIWTQLRPQQRGALVRELWRAVEESLQLYGHRVA